MASVAVSAAPAEDPAGTLRALRTAPLSPVPAEVWGRWLRQLASARAGAWLESLAGGAPAVPIRLVGPRGDHPAWEAVLARAQALTEEGVAASALDLDRVAALEQGLGRARRALAGADDLAGAARARAVLDELAPAVEVARWRLAAEVAHALAGSAAVSRLAGWPEALLADPAGEMALLEPPHPDYPILRRGLGRLESLARAAEARGGEGLPLPKLGGLAPGGRHPAVLGVRRRLEALGLEAGQGDRWDDALLAGIAAFQVRHAIDPSGRLGPETLRELAVPLAARISAVERALERLRSGPGAAEPDRVVVNIPAFRLELVRGHVPVLHSRVVVGRNRLSGDPESGERGYLDRTPVLASRIHTIVLNPPWVVPRRVKELELDPAAASDPSVYEGFELTTGADGVERAVQLPGPHNALGRVKFVFDGGGGVYLHDTPRKKAFATGQRALSHGCVRVERALELLRALLELDAHPLAWADAERLLARGQEARVALGRAVPVVLEYQTVGVEEGELRFYPDLYEILEDATARRAYSP